MANDPKWTAGPWRVEQDTTLVWGNCNPDDTSSRGMGYPITECRITPVSLWAKGPDADEGEANARLIAAAPDMYEALKWALPLARMHMETVAGDRAKAGHTGLGTKRSSLYDSEVEEAERAVAALSKARGE